MHIRKAGRHREGSRGRENCILSSAPTFDSLEALFLIRETGWTSCRNTKPSSPNIHFTYYTALLLTNTKSAAFLGCYLERAKKRRETDTSPPVTPAVHSRCATCAHPPVVVEPWLPLVPWWEGFLLGWLAKWASVYHIIKVNIYFFVNIIWVMFKILYFNVKSLSSPPTP